MLEHCFISWLRAPNTEVLNLRNCLNYSCNVLRCPKPAAVNFITWTMNPTINFKSPEQTNSTSKTITCSLTLEKQQFIHMWTYTKTRLTDRFWEYSFFLSRFSQGLGLDKDIGIRIAGSEIFDLESIVYDIFSQNVFNIYNLPPPLPKKGRGNCSDSGDCLCQRGSGDAKF